VTQPGPSTTRAAGVPCKHWPTPLTTSSSGRGPIKHRSLASNNLPSTFGGAERQAMIIITSIREQVAVKRSYGSISNALKVLGVGEGDPGNFTWRDIVRIDRAFRQEHSSVA